MWSVALMEPLGIPIYLEMLELLLYKYFYLDLENVFYRVVL